MIENRWQALQGYDGHWRRVALRPDSQDLWELRNKLGVSFDRLAELLQLTPEKARRVIDGYHALTPDEHCFVGLLLALEEDEFEHYKRSIQRVTTIHEVDPRRWEAFR